MSSEEFRLEFVNKPEPIYFRQEINKKYFLTLGVAVRFCGVPERVKSILEGVAGSKIRYELCFDSDKSPVALRMPSGEQCLKVIEDSPKTIQHLTDGILIKFQVLNCNGRMFRKRNIDGLDGEARSRSGLSIKEPLFVLRVSLHDCEFLSNIERASNKWYSAPFKVLTKRKHVAFKQKVMEIRERDLFAEKIYECLRLHCTKCINDPAYQSQAAFSMPFIHLFRLQPLEIYWPKMPWKYVESPGSAIDRTLGNEKHSSKALAGQEFSSKPLPIPSADDLRPCIESKRVKRYLAPNITTVNTVSETVVPSPPRNGAHDELEQIALRGLAMMRAEKPQRIYYREQDSSGIKVIVQEVHHTYFLGRPDDSKPTTAFPCHTSVPAVTSGGASMDGSQHA